MLLTKFRPVDGWANFRRAFSRYAGVDNVRNAPTWSQRHAVDDESERAPCGPRRLKLLHPTSEEVFLRVLHIVNLSRGGRGRSVFQKIIPFNRRGERLQVLYVQWLRTFYSPKALNVEIRTRAPIFNSVFIFQVSL